jgi:hypothetical protein
VNLPAFKAGRFTMVFYESPVRGKLYTSELSSMRKETQPLVPDVAKLDRLDGVPK